MEGIPDRDSCKQFLVDGAFEAGEAVRGYEFCPVPSRLRAFLQSSSEDLLGTALAHVQGRDGPVLLRIVGEVDDDGGLLVTMAGVSPDMLVNTNDFHTVEAVRVIDQHALSLGQDGVVRRIP